MTDTKPKRLRPLQTADLETMPAAAALRNAERSGARRGGRDGGMASHEAGTMEADFADAPRADSGGRQDFSSSRPLRESFDVKALPQRRKPRRFRTILSFLIFVVLPVTIAAIYYWLIASNQYVVEFKFIVQDTTAPASMSSPSILASMLGASQASPTMTQNYVVVDYLTSRQAVDDLQARIKLKDFYTRPNIDWWARFDPTRPTEDFVKYWQRIVTANNDYVTGLATVRVRAFSPQDAKLIGDTMSTLSEELVEGMAARAKLNAVRFAENDVQRTENRLKENRRLLTEFRNKYGVVDPSTSVVASNSALSLSLRASLSQLETSRASLIKQNIGPNAPAIQTLNSQIKATKEQIVLVEAQVARNEGDPPLSETVARYEQLDMERQFSQTQLTSTMTALDMARAYAASQQIYITPFVRPALPDSSTYPQRFISVLIVAALACLAWIVFGLITRSMRDYQT